MIQGEVRDMDLSLFDYHLAESAIAQQKASPRDSSKLFFIDARGSSPVHRHLRFSDIEDVLQTRDLLILNRSRVIPAKVPARKTTGGRAEVLLLERMGEFEWKALVGGKRIAEGSSLRTGDGAVTVEIVKRLEEGRCEVGFHRLGRKMDHGEVMEWLRMWGLMPTPPYIKRFLEDPEEYQTIYGDVEGSVAAPTAGLHFTEGLLRRLEEKGIRIEYIVLHVGIGTFAPVKTEDIREHRMEEEEFFIPVSVKDAVREAVTEYHTSGSPRIWIVGTTTMRTMESAFDDEGNCVKESGRTGLYITPGYEFKLPYKGFITNFHLPRSTPLILLSAFYDRENVLKAYREALEMDYRFYSLGDSMMIRRN
ncbi:MAG: tRNA preQ1(34) S-adenosylmethionine ribosyltransferase-isomerase QueA [Candidatus Thermoplasmatota archaeon]|nr:tRNA preQ1(34) S-adenosylmethionine ribosyltransferase-isomerase QueA [Candidatus Thermoplasmatota archaeon]